MALANTLAYYDKATITSVKSFKVQAREESQNGQNGLKVVESFCNERLTHKSSKSNQRPIL